ncbi:MAG: zf-HC2 domain-containing protein [Gemmatimonadota bacterium]|nr:zf-HC2 domain-containing protein [Gemmatimonadota bacterium]
MNDCVNGDIRDVLPELVSGTLPAGDLARVQDHIRACADCAAEVELLRTARAAMRLAPTMNTTRIAAGVQASTAQRLAARRIPARVARMASVSLIVVLGAIGLWASRDTSSDTSSDTPREASPVAGQPSAGGAGISTAAPGVAGAVEEPRPARGPAQLALGGDMSQLDDDELLALMDELSGLEAIPGEEPASITIEPVMPVQDEL